MRIHVRTLLGMALVAALVVGCGPSASIGNDAATDGTLIEDARSLKDSSDLDGALAKAQAAVEADPGSAEAQFLLGNAYANKGSFTKAEEAFRKALELDDDYSDARANLGVALYNQQKFSDAEDAFRQVLSALPDDAEVRYNLGGVLAAQQRLSEAEAEFLRAVEIDPDLAEPYLGLGSVYKELGRDQEAIDALKEYVKRSADATWKTTAEQMIRELGGQP